MSNLVDHARRELALIGEDNFITEGLLKMVEIFAGMGHSGSSAEYTAQTLDRLLRFKNLKPLTNDPEEWMHVGGSRYGTPDNCWQNRRNPEAFSHDGGKTYYLLSEGGSDKNRQPLHTSAQKS